MRRVRSDSIDQYSDLAGRTKFVCDWISKEHVIGCEVLEVGSGTGWFANFIATNYQVRRYVGLEIDDNARMIAKQGVQYSFVDFVAGSGLNLPFEDNSFDTCVTYDVIEHIPIGMEKLFLSEICRVLRPGGCLYLSTPNHHVLATYTDPAFYLQGHRHYSKYKLESVAQQSELEVAQSFTRGGISEVFLLFNVYFSKWVLNRAPIFIKKHGSYVQKSYDSRRGFMNRFLFATKPK
jgi:SAM-dependent methyltransferase